MNNHKLTYEQKYCIIGAGSSGLVAAKNLLQHGIPCDVLERESEIGGVWNYASPNSSVYRSTHLISSKPMTEFTDFPMPEDYPDYPHHTQVLEYFHAYVRAFNLRPHIGFNAKVERLEPSAGMWLVTLASGETRRYRGVIIANGHLWDPNYPEYPGEFNGRVLHSKQYKTPDILADKRVLVVGAGNSGCDIAVEAAQHAQQAFLSVRRGYHFIPKFMFGKPADQVGEIGLKLRIPLPIRRTLNTFLLHKIYGQPEDFGLPAPDHKLYESHPIVNSQIYYYLGHGDLKAKPDVQKLRGDKVEFIDGSLERIDVIVYATGYKISFPFIDKQYLNWQDNHPKLFLHIFHPQYDNLFVAGMLQPDSGQWGLVDYQTQLIAKFIKAQKTNPRKAEAFRKLKRKAEGASNGRIRYVDSLRHKLEVEHFSYRQRLKKLIKMFH